MPRVAGANRPTRRLIGLLTCEAAARVFCNLSTARPIGIRTYTVASDSITNVGYTCRLPVAANRRRLDFVAYFYN